MPPVLCPPVQKKKKYIDTLGPVSWEAGARNVPGDREGRARVSLETSKGTKINSDKTQQRQLQPDIVKNNFHSEGLSTIGTYLEGI